MNKIRIFAVHHLIKRMTVLNISFPKAKKFLLIVRQIWGKASKINKKGRRGRGVLKAGGYSGYLLLHTKPL